MEWPHASSYKFLIFLQHLIPVIRNTTLKRNPITNLVLNRNYYGPLSTLLYNQSEDIHSNTINSCDLNSLKNPTKQLHCAFVNFFIQTQIQLLDFKSIVLFLNTRKTADILKLTSIPGYSVKLTSEEEEKLLRTNTTLVILPILNNSHYQLLIIDNSTKTYYFFDSINTKADGSKYVEMIIQKRKRYKKMDYWTQASMIYPGQHDGSSCGVYLVWYFYNFVKNWNDLHKLNVESFELGVQNFEAHKLRQKILMLNEENSGSQNEYCIFCFKTDRSDMNYCNLCDRSFHNVCRNFTHKYIDNKFICARCIEYLEYREQYKL